jgi:hypothetical protein
MLKEKVKVPNNSLTYSKISKKRVGAPENYMMTFGCKRGGDDKLFSMFKNRN